MTEQLPAKAAAIADQHPQVWKAFQGLGKACSQAGPLDDRTRRLIKVALAVGGKSEGAVHSHVRQALNEGLSGDEIRHVALLAAPTLGFPAAVAALTWIEDVLGSS
jgi:alkylhydroperoxidase/carboxymuconolactone decarboxylase family protein YurZ